MKKLKKNLIKWAIYGVVFGFVIIPFLFLLSSIDNQGLFTDRLTEVLALILFIPGKAAQFICNEHTFGCFGVTLYTSPIVYGIIFPLIYYFVYLLRK